jgi:hypothetical protein
MNQYPFNFYQYNLSALMRFTHIADSNKVSGLFPKFIHYWVMICFFWKIKSKFAESKGWQAPGRISADCQVFIEGPINAFRPIVGFTNDCCGVGVPFFKEMFNAVCSRSDIVGCTDRKAEQIGVRI